MSQLKMVVVGGVRFRPEDAPEVETEEVKAEDAPEVETEEVKAAPTPGNKARPAQNKGA